MKEIFRWLCGGLILVGACVFLFFIALDFLARILIYRDEVRLRRKLELSGRFIAWPEIEARFAAGTGTLIVEHRSPKGPIREWWTEEDLIGAAPVPLPVSIKSLPNDEHVEAHKEYSNLCCTQYVDVAGGSAKATAFPIALSRRLDPRKYIVVSLGGGVMTAIVLPTGRRLAKKYPQGKVVMLLTWSDEPLLFVGDAEAVFLSKDKPNAAPGEGA
jgi:hypothetical protein